MVREWYTRENKEEVVDACTELQSEFTYIAIRRAVLRVNGWIIESDTCRLQYYMRADQEGVSITVEVIELEINSTDVRVKVWKTRY